MPIYSGRKTGVVRKYPVEEYRDCRCSGSEMAHYFWRVPDSGILTLFASWIPGYWET